MRRPFWIRGALLTAVTAALTVVSASPAAAELTPIDFIEITTGSYEEIAPEIYEGNLLKPTEFWLDVQPWSQGEKLLGIGCKTEITIRGYFGFIEIHESNGRCNTTNPGALVKVPFDGKYLITATVTRSAGSFFTATKEILVGPASFVPAAIDTGSALIGGPTGSSTTGSAG
ncbi:hypothetical protein [Rhodococcoides yunnanense]|uniref:hypothetical protein n=1 Tax=Rhodococcoides yunnanense TaxID=278209 RepID=UPI001114F9C3|nr:hypothetical protein [Rhodococcus yunnanensis]